MQTRQLGPFSVSAIGLGCMNLSHAYGAPVSREQGERVLLAALDAGVTFFDTAALYGFGANETLVGEVMKSHRNKFILASKCGMQGVDKGDGTKVRVIDGRPATIRQTCEDALRRLQTDVIDLYLLAPLGQAGADRRKRGRFGRPGACGQDSHHWFVRGVCHHLAQGARRAPDHGGADRVFAMDTQPGNCGTGRLSRVGHCVCAFQPGGAWLFVWPTGCCRF